MPGYCNLFTGWPGSGKSEFVRQLLLLQAVFAEKKTLIFAPEDMPKESWYDALIHSLTGQDPDPEAQHALPKAYYKRAAEWVRGYFSVVVAPKGYGKTPGHILDVFEAARAKHGFDHYVLDPWNKCDHSGMVAAGGFQPYLVKELGNFTDCENPDVLIAFDWKTARYSFNGTVPLAHPLVYSLYGDMSKVAEPAPEPAPRGGIR
nr:hypothetical protein [Tanacetum cinerariifolium]